MVEAMIIRGQNRGLSGMRGFRNQKLYFAIAQTIMLPSACQKLFIAKDSAESQ